MRIKWLVGALILRLKFATLGEEGVIQNAHDMIRHTTQNFQMLHVTCRMSLVTPELGLLLLEMCDEISIVVVIC